MYEDFSSLLLIYDMKNHGILLSFEFYILSGRFNIQHIIDVYLDPMLEQTC